MEPKSNYVTLLILIIFGVALGNLASSFITAKYFQKEPQKEITEIAKTPKIAPVASSTKPKEPAKAEITRETVKLSPEEESEPKSIFETPEKPIDSEEMIEQRRLDENGLRLSKKCNEWTVVHKDMNTPSSERGMNKHCSEYYDYLSFGNLPEAN